VRGRWWVLLVVAAVVVLLAGSGQVWVEATADDAVLGTTPVAVTGGTAAGSVAAAALLAGAAVLGGLVGSRPVRVTAALFLVLAGVIGGWATLGVVLDPVGTADAAASERTAVTGAGAGIVGEASVTVWAWLALLACGLVTVCGLLALVTLLRPRTSGERGAPVRTGRRGLRDGPPGGLRSGPVGAETAWERLSRGEDPTEPADRGDHGPEDAEPGRPDR
jgi:uncharacterized membrane protein (TIGR02234 family)